MSSPDTIRIPLPDTERPRLLNSWKEIARYLDRGVRTVQRWEATMGLPVHRPKGRLHSSVFALAHEIDRWLLKIPSARLGGDPNGRIEELNRHLAASRALRAESRSLCAQIQQGVREHHQVCAGLRKAVARLAMLRGQLSNSNARAAAAPLPPLDGEKGGSAA